jgi:hypothetical protein
MSGLVLSKSLLKEADLRGPPNPLMFKERINIICYEPKLSLL